LYGAITIGGLSEWQYEVNNVLMDNSLYLQLSLAWIAFSIVKGGKASSSFRLPLILFFCFLPSVVHLVIHPFVSSFAVEAFHAANSSIVFILVTALFTVTLLELKSLQVIHNSKRREGTLSAGEERRFMASSMMLSFVKLFTIINLVTWSPHLAVAWYKLFDQLAKLHPTVQYMEMVGVSLKGFYHASAVLFTFYIGPAKYNWTHPYVVETGYLPDTTKLFSNIVLEPRPILEAKRVKAVAPLIRMDKVSVDGDSDTVLDI
jgi:heme/copper-type cytochrome/quinol oxidase subunit 4